MALLEGEVEKRMPTSTYEIGEFCRGKDSTLFKSERRADIMRLYQSKKQKGYIGVDAAVYRMWLSL